MAAVKSIVISSAEPATADRATPDAELARRALYYLSLTREVAYFGLDITWDMIMNSQQDLSPKEFGYDVKMEAPPLPVPGQYKFV